MARKRKPSPPTDAQRVELEKLIMVDATSPAHAVRSAMDGNILNRMLMRDWIARAEGGGPYVTAAGLAVAHLRKAA